MPDVIHLLPDSVANQIAAGEVIQRPASAVKELLENAIDSGATQIRVLIRDAGKTLIQVSDNGCGMSMSDARLCFERHATSKIQKAGDLFAIRTMGFRGEALASVAAIAQVELRTKRHEDELGTLVAIEGSELKTHESCACSNGTTLAVKNLFFNTPARRNFLKSNEIETRHIIEEFTRVALVRPETAFTLTFNSKLLFQLEKAGLKQRIVALFGNAYSQRLVPVDHRTDFLSITGFIGKPEFAKKTRGEQYFFANQRFIRHPFFHHAVENAFIELIPEQSHPSYFIYFETDPSKIDVNIHPTKTEIKFQDEKLIYATVRAAVKHALGKFSLTPSIDFEVEPSIDFLSFPKDKPVTPPVIHIDPDFSPFRPDKASGSSQSSTTAREKANRENWMKLFQTYDRKVDESSVGHDEREQKTQHVIDSRWIDDSASESSRVLMQVRNSFILSTVRSGILFIDQQRAHERILYEKYMESLERRVIPVQEQLFPQEIELNPGDAALLEELSEDLSSLGFNVETQDGNPGVFMVRGLPCDLKDRDVRGLIEAVLENYKRYFTELGLNRKINLARSLARNTSVKYGKALGSEEMHAIIDHLFACRVPDTSPSGQPTYVILAYEEIENMLKNGKSPTFPQ